MQIRIDSYYDITCDECGRSWSTDFDGDHMSYNALGGGMGMSTDKKWLKKAAYKSGWKCKGGKTLCPDCVEFVNAPKCYNGCLYLITCEEEYDVEPNGFCTYSPTGNKYERRWVDSMSNICDGHCVCPYCN